MPLSSRHGLTGAAVDPASSLTRQDHCLVATGIRQLCLKHPVCAEGTSVPSATPVITPRSSCREVSGLLPSDPPEGSGPVEGWLAARGLSRRLRSILAPRVAGHMACGSQG